VGVTTVIAVRALVLESFSGPDAVAVRDVPEPEGGDGSVLLEVRAAATGPWDIATTYGAFAGGGGQSGFPQVLGWDVAGVRADTGQRVAGFVAQPWAGVGVFAERVALPESALAPIPDGLEDEAAATLGVTALTARLALDTAARPRGAHVLVVGAGGAVGSAVVALGVADGLVVSGSAGTADAERIRAAGGTPLDRARDLGAQQREAGLPAPDAVIDFVGGDAGAAAMELLADGGMFVSATPNAVPGAVRGIEPTVISVHPDGAGLARLLPRFATGELPVPRFETAPLEQGAEAFRRFASGGVVGKLVLVP